MKRPPLRVSSPPWGWLLAFWSLALVLALLGLGNVPLRDWDEAIVARVALEFSRHHAAAGLLPTYLGEAYLNKPPGLHLAIAGAIRLWSWASGSLPGVLPPEWVVRLVPALLSSLLVPLLGLVQWRLRPRQPAAAIATALITLTLLPLARHGRLAMLDGTQLTAMTLIWIGVLSAERQQAERTWGGGLLAGLGGSLLLLLKAPVALPVVAVTLLLRRLDRDLSGREWRWLLAGLLVGLVPGIGWHLWNLAIRGSAALVMWGPQGMARLLESVNGNSGGPLMPLTQVLIGGWPWLPLLPFGLAQAWRERQARAGRWTLGLGLLACLLVLPLRTQLPWYSLLLWPPFALACGPVLADLATAERSRRLTRWLGTFWAGLGFLMLIAFAVLERLPGKPVPMAGLIAAIPAGVGLLVGGWQLARPHRPRRAWVAMPIVASGWILALGVLFLSPLWNWELSQQAPLTPALRLAEHAEGQPLHLLEGDEQSQRPSLNWYLNASSPPLDEHGADWPRQRFHLLAHAEHRSRRVEENCQLEQSGENGWMRWECQARADGT